MPNLSKNPDPTESGDSSGSRSAVPPQFGSPFDYDATADASLSETSAPTEKTPSTENTGTGPGWDTYSGVGNGPGWANHPIYPPPVDADPTAAFPAAAYPAAEPALPSYPPPAAPVEGPVYGVPAEQNQNPYAAPPQQGYPTQPQMPAYGQPQPYAQSYGFANSSAPFGYDPITGQPLSDKSKSTAGLLQILLGFIGICGVGRLYIGSTAIGLIQLLGIFVGYILIFVAIGFLVVPAIWIWAFVDGIMMLSGSVRDGQGRPLRS